MLSTTFDLSIKENHQLTVFTEDKSLKKDEKEDTFTSHDFSESGS